MIQSKIQVLPGHFVSIASAQMHFSLCFQGAQMLIQSSLSSVITLPSVNLDLAVPGVWGVI